MMNPAHIQRSPKEKGDWKLRKMTVNFSQAVAFNARIVSNGEPPERFINEGSYWVLSHREHGTVMSNTPAEIKDHEAFFQEASGNVLITGLGLGMAAEVVASKSEVNSVTVVEIDANVIEITRSFLKSPKIKIVHANAFDYTPENRVDIVWHDIWPSISDLNLLEMKTLKEKYAPFAEKQGFWAEKECWNIKAITDFNDFLKRSKRK